MDERDEGAEPLCQMWLMRLAHYNEWMNERLYALAATLDESDRRRDLDAFFGSVHGTLSHLLLADRLWLGRFADIQPAFAALSQAAVLRATDLESSDRGSTRSGLETDLWPEFDVMAEARGRTDTVICRWVEELTQDRLQQTFTYATVAGVHLSHRLAPAVLHFFNHQTHHRGQVTTLLHQLGLDPGITDLLMLPGFLDASPPRAVS